MEKKKKRPLNFPIYYVKQKKKIRKEQNIQIFYDSGISNKNGHISPSYH